MRDFTRDVMKAHCQEIGMALRVIFWCYAVFLVGSVCYGIWMCFQPADYFTVAARQGGSAGIYILNIGLKFGTIDTEGILSGTAGKSASVLVYWLTFLVRGITLLVLANMRRIFRNIEKYETPFLTENCRAVFFIGVFLILSSAVKTVLLPAVGLFTGILGQGTRIYLSMNSILVGGTVICLSYIFEYGTFLQKESDETL